MQFYPSLFAYLNQRNPVSEDTVLEVRDRPIMTLNHEENLSHGLIKREQGVYEIPFPYLKIPEIEHHGNQLQYALTLEVNQTSVTIKVTDEVVDQGNFEDENQAQEWQQKLGDRFDDTVACCLQIFTGFWETLITEKVGREAQVRVIELINKVKDFKIEEAKKPLVITLEKRYKLEQKLQLIAPKLRQQLRRKAELMPVGRIQEMDAYCLRDYTRRPGHTAAEKAGSRQELMGIRREQSYNTPENQFLIYFAGKILYLELLRLGGKDQDSNYPEVKIFRKAIKAFRQQPSVQPILRSLKRFQLLKPNYVLLQNPIYNSFYRGYQDYLAKRTEKEKVWGYRHPLFADVIYLCWVAAFMGFQNSSIEPLSNLKRFMSPEKGHYLISEAQSLPKFQVFLKDKVFCFSLEKSTHLGLGDWVLNLEIHDLNSLTLDIQEIKIPIWVFWYCPTKTALQEAVFYIQRNPKIKTAILFYLQETPHQFSTSNQGRILHNQTKSFWLIETPNFLEDEGLMATLNQICDLIKKLITLLT